MATIVSGISVLNSGMSLLSETLNRSKAETAEPEQPPLFVIGHWRTGTTLLHELLVQDERFAYPTTYQCMAPAHFLLTSKIFGPIIDFLMPSKRPMDDMAVGCARPQEDEFALVNLGVPSNYLDWAFPNREDDYDDYVGLENLPSAERESWKEHFHWFLRRLTVYSRKRLVLKSPTHTARIKTLLEIVPNARFVHIVRDPMSVLPSTLRTWTRMTDALSLQVRKNEYTLDGRVEVFNKMYERFWADQELIPQANYFELRFEDLVANPVDSLSNIYAQLDLDDFAPARAGILEYLEGTKEFQGNKHEVPEEMRRKISEGCGEYMKRYGYTA